MAVLMKPSVNVKVESGKARSQTEKTESNQDNPFVVGD
jgi:hypothetical protein